jgi:tetratricopeptide (TPR) repeat protein
MQRKIRAQTWPSPESRAERIHLRVEAAIDEADARCHYQRGATLAASGQHDEAIASFQRALALNANSAVVHNDLGNALRAIGQQADALASYQRALRCCADYPEAHHNVSITLGETGNMHLALAHARRAIDLRPHFHEAYHNLAALLTEVGQLDAAFDAYAHSLALHPEQPAARHGLAMLLLSRGEFAAGWCEYEWRWQTPQMASSRRSFIQPQWRGELGAGRTLLIHAEQGFGDTLQFCRYAPLAAQRGWRVVLEAPAPLVRLLRSLPSVADVLAQGDALPPFDAHCPMMSLPLAFGTALSTIPAANAYLEADAAQVAAWQTRLGDNAQRDLRVGLVWAGNPRPHSPAAAAIDRRRSMSPTTLADLFEIPGVQFFSLQQAAQSPPAQLIDFMPEMTDFADTAALITQLDLVIAVDTAVAHLAAALGKPVWLLDRYAPCWRWLRDRNDSPWYPSLRIYRQQQPGDWPSVLAQVTADLARQSQTHAALNQALQHHQAQQWQAAEAQYQQILTLDASNARTLHLLGVLAQQTGRPHQAITWLRQAIAHHPADAGAHYNLGTALGKIGQWDDAIAHYRQALALAPDFVEALHNLGDALSRQGQHAAAADCFLRALQLRPNFAEAANHAGVACMHLQQTDAAIAHYQTALTLRPDYADAYNNLGVALADARRLDEAIAAYDQALALQPHFVQALSNRALALCEQGRLAESLATHRHALALDPDSAPERARVHFNYSIALLTAGDIPAGWEEHEWRWQLPDLLPQRGFRQPQWRGEPAPGNTLLIHPEGGFGDVLQFCRYAPLAAARGLRVLLEVPAPLVRLLRTLPGVERVLALGEALPPFDWHCPIQSLARAFATTLATIPAPIPYLHANPAHVTRWQARFAPYQALRVGLVWAGNPLAHTAALAAMDRRRSMPPAKLAPLFAIPGIQMFGLQKSGPACPAHLPLVSFMDEAEDFADTAALITQLDLVIAVDTAVAHLAGALGKPVWLLNRFDACWRWLPHAPIERRDSPWYPSFRLYRQPDPGDWESPLAELAADLAQLVAHWRASD